MNITKRIHPPGGLLRLIAALWVLWLGLAGAQSACTVNVTPAAPQAGQAVSALFILNESSPGAYTLDWGDGTRTPFTATSATPVQVAKPTPYSTPSTYAVSASGPSGGLGACRTTVTVTQAPVTFDVQPRSGTTATSFTAIYTNVPANTTYSLAWGDGQGTTITAPGSGSLTHTYSSPGGCVALIGLG